LQDLELTSGTLVEKNGHAMAQVLVHNPTESPLEFETRCRFQEVEGVASRNSFSLMLPVRAGLEEPDRFIAKVLPRTTVRVENFLPHPVFSGQHRLFVEIHSRGRVQQQAEFPIDVTAGNFPAQDASVVRVARDLLVSPVQLELSLQRGGKRMVPVTIENTSRQKLTVTLSHEQDGEADDWLRIRPDTFELEPGKFAKAMLSVRSGFDIAKNRYAALRIDATPASGTSVGSQTLPVALLARTDESPELHASSIRWVDETHRSALTATFSNHGKRHAELTPRLRLTDGFGRGAVLVGGYGRWLLPGESTEVEFPLTAVPPPGVYQAELLIDRDNQAPEVLISDEVFVP